MPRQPRSSKSKAIAAIKKMYKKRKYVRKNVLVNKALRPFPQRFITKMKYCEAISITGGGPQGYRFRLNSTFDPNETGVGHQPYGRDTLVSIYNRYRVISCSYVISAVDSAGQYIQVAALPANDTVLTLSTSDMRENPRCKYMVQAPNAALKVLKGNVYLPSLVGRSKAQYMADDRYQADSGSNPAENAILNVFFQNMADGLNTLNVLFNITLEYTVEWFDVKNLAQS